MGTGAQYFFRGLDKEIGEKQNFFVNYSIPENFHWENSSWHTLRKSLQTQDCEKKLETNFGPSFGRPKLGECVKMWSVS